MTVNCTSQSSVSRIKVEENGKQAVIKNPGNEVFFLTKVDGCLAKNQVASDWAISKPEKKDIVAIELKGCDVDHAVDQIKGTLRMLRKDSNNKGRSAGLIVCARYPRIDTKIQRAKQALANEFKAPLHIVCRNDEFDFPALLSFLGPYRA